MKPVKQLFLFSLILILILSLYLYVTKSKEPFNELSPRYCKGGSYLWQGEGPVSKYCRELASTPEGMEKIKAQSCGLGCMGRPLNEFEDTPMSNSLWKNEMC
jgi:hypothetical protein